MRAAPVAARLPGAPMAAMRPCATPMSAGTAPDGNTAVPCATIRSNMLRPLGSRSSGRHRRQRFGASEGEAREYVVASDAVHDELQAAAAVVVRPALEPDRRIERVLRALHEGRAIRAIA